MRKHKRKFLMDFWDLLKLFEITLGREPCWIWPHAVNKSGYGSFWYGRQVRTAHRSAFEALRSPVPSNLELDHLRCSERRCFNPWHLRPVTSKENTLRSETNFAAINSRKTHCPAGHPLTPENLVPSDLPRRRCLTCHRKRCADGMRLKRAAQRTALQ